MSCFVIAEAGVNHNGSLDRAIELIECAAAAGADAVKFQTFRAEDLVCPGTKTADYQKLQTGEEDQYSMLKRLELSPADYRVISKRCEEVGVEFLSTPFSHEAALMLLDLGMRRVKVPSGELTNLPFLEFLAEKNIPLIVSTGMANLEEVKDAVSAIRTSRAAKGFHESLGQVVTLLHCTSNYPTKFSDVNLRAMITLRDEFGLPVGYSDHTQGVAIAIGAVALGATVIEKHLTLDRTLSGPDHKASLEPSEFRDMIQGVRAVEKSLGSSDKQPCPNELPVRNLVRRSVVLKRQLKANEKIHKEDLALLRPGTGIPPKDMHRVIGSRARIDLPAEKILEWSDLVV